MTAELFKKIGSYNKNFDKARILEAFNFITDRYLHTGADLHSTLAALEILLPLKPNEDTILAVLLHDLFVQSLVSEETIKEKFGQSVLDLLMALKRLYGLNYEENDKGAQVEVLRKMFLTLAKDIRVILIWLAHRLAILQNIAETMDGAERLRMAKETMNVYVPIASRLGIYKIKTQLEDLCFKYLHPEEYERLYEQIKKFTESENAPIELIKQQLATFLKNKGIEAEIQGRIKNIYSLYSKLARKGCLNVNELYDFFAIRVILPCHEEMDKLYGVLGLIHSEWKPISSRFKDYIAVPKPNGYRSLHTVVLGLGPKGFDKPVEIQIRDEKMHRESEYGVASHWLYKAKNSSKIQDLNSQVDWIRGLEQIHEFFGKDSEMMKEVEVDIFKDRIFVLTPRGEVKDLPVGSIPLDFAYAVHTDVGNHCIASKVNGAMVPLDWPLKNGDVVEILTRNDASPKPKWLPMVRSSFARNKIKAWFSGLNRDKNIKEGRELINAQLERLNKPLLDQSLSILKDYDGANLTLSKRESLLEEIGKGGKSSSDVVRKLYPYEKLLPTDRVVMKAASSLDQGKTKPGVTLESQVIVGGQTGFPVKLASCCKPKLGQKIIGYVNSRSKRISVHRFDCTLLDSLNPERILFAEWKGFGAPEMEGGFKVGIGLTVVSRVGLIHDVSSVISNMGVNILDVVIKKAGGGLYHDYFLVALDDLGKFDLLLDKLEEIEGVVKAVQTDRFV